MSDGCRHAANLTIAPLAKRNFQPRRLDILSESYRNSSSRQVRFSIKQFYTCGLGRFPLNHNAGPEASHNDRRGNSFNLNEISPRVIKLRIGKPVQCESIVGEKQKPFTVCVEPSSRIHGSGERTEGS
jgi:hypothetical protein